MWKAADLDYDNHIKMAELPRDSHPDGGFGFFVVRLCQNEADDPLVLVERSMKK